MLAVTSGFARTYACAFPMTAIKKKNFFNFILSYVLWYTLNQYL